MIYKISEPALSYETNHKVRLNNDLQTIFIP